MTISRRCLIGLAVICTLGLPTSTGTARDRSFSAVLEGLERDYHVQPKSIPGLWLGKLFVRVTHPSGVSKMDLAIFEDQKLREVAAQPGFDTRLHSLLGTAWKPFMQVDAPKRRERVLLFARPKGSRIDLFIFSVEKSEAVAILVRLKPDSLQGVFDHPTSVAHR